MGTQVQRNPLIMKTIFCSFLFLLFQPVIHDTSCITLVFEINTYHFFYIIYLLSILSVLMSVLKSEIDCQFEIHSISWYIKCHIQCGPSMTFWVRYIKVR